VKRFLIFLLVGAAGLPTSGCKRSAPAGPPSSVAPQGKQYPVKGKVVSTDPAHGEVTVDAAAIPGFMEAMTMPYKLRTPNILSELHPGDQITATLYVTDSDDLLDQIGQTLANVVAVLRVAGATPQDVTTMTWFLTDLAEYRAALKRMGPVYRDVMGRHFPPMAVVGVAGLVEPRAKVEIQATAVIPD